MSNKAQGEDDKIEILMKKINELEGKLTEERKKSFESEKELQNLSNITLPLLKKNLEEKEKLLENTMLEHIKLEKEIYYLKEKANKDNLLKISKYIIPDLQDEKEKMIIHQSNKIDYLSNVYSEIKKKYNSILIEKEQMKKEYDDKVTIQKDEIESLKSSNTQHEEQIASLNKEVSNLSLTNRNLLIEISSLNKLLSDYIDENEQYQLQANYYKKENDFAQKHLNDNIARMQKMDESYQKMYNTLEEYKKKISELDTKTYIFNVISVGRVIENSAEIVFNKEGRNTYVINFKYMTSSTKYDILDIESITQVEGEENTILIKYKFEKNLPSELFRTNEVAKIMKVFKDFQTKAIQHLDVKKQQKEDRMKQKQIKKNVKEMFSIFGN